ncbi:MAG: hypothetical protein MUF07_15810 [Steroidobacteraceae bacterium]|nr:hypothetical protein [Steroidobacteraceae bacterium]
MIDIAASAACQTIVRRMAAPQGTPGMGLAMGGATGWAGRGLMPVLLVVMLVSAGIPQVSLAQGLQSERALQAAGPLPDGSGDRAHAPRVVVLTPVLPARLTIAGIDEKALLTAGFSDARGPRRNDVLNQQSQDPTFERSAHLLQALLTALQPSPSSPAVLSLAIPREDRAGRASLSRETFPSAAIAQLLAAGSTSAASGAAGAAARVLDVTVHELGLLASGGKDGRLRPSGYATYRVLDVDGGIVQLTRPVLVNSAGPRAVGPFSANAGPVAPAKDALKPDPACEFRRLPEDPAGLDRLRACVNGVLTQVAEAIAADPVLRPGAAMGGTTTSGSAPP